MPPRKPLKKYPLENIQNQKYILYYCSSFAVLLGISEGIRKLETLIARMA